MFYDKINVNVNVNVNRINSKFPLKGEEKIKIAAPYENQLSYLIYPF